MWWQHRDPKMVMTTSKTFQAMNKDKHSDLVSWLGCSNTTLLGATGQGISTAHATASRHARTLATASRHVRSPEPCLKSVIVRVCLIPAFKHPQQSGELLLLVHKWLMNLVPNCLRQIGLQVDSQLHSRCHGGPWVCSSSTGP